MSSSVYALIFCVEEKKIQNILIREHYMGFELPVFPKLKRVKEKRDCILSYLFSSLHLNSFDMNVKT